MLSKNELRELEESRMTPKKLLAIAEQLAECATDNPVWRKFGYVAGYVLANVREDDDEPVTREKLHKYETHYFGESLYSCHEFTGSLVCWYAGEDYQPQKATWTFYGIQIDRVVETLKDLRELCRGLGIELKEKE